jgi:glutamyl-tRNA synthetase
VQNSPEIVTRFAPSPTGYLHIGGARTALFNYLFARRNGGTFKLRIEDTDRARSSEDAVKAILDGLEWLGVTWDGEPVSQFARADRHRETVEQLIANGAAFRCYATPEEVETLREAAFAEGRALRSPWRDRDASEAPEGAPFVVRFRAPDRDVVVADLVQGDVRWAAKEFDDLVLLRADGAPTYNLAVVVDDHDMGITHVIRGDDHLTNAGRQTQIYQALGWTAPPFAHIPLIHGPDGKKLSKRHGALGVEAYREMGYLPQALRNYLVRLGWSHGDDEVMSLDQMIEWFEIEDINKGAARFDVRKLEALNGLYMRKSDDETLLEQLIATLPHLPNGALIADGLTSERNAQLLAAMPGLKDRAKTLVELADSAKFLFTSRPLDMDEKASGILADGGREVIAALRPRLEAVDAWTAESLEAEVRTFAEETGAKLGKVAQPLRAALTGRAVSPGVFDVLAVLGREESLARLGDVA